MAPAVLASRIQLPESGREALLVALNRPEKKNCFNAQVCHELATICECIAGDGLEDDMQ